MNSKAFLGTRKPSFVDSPCVIIPLVPNRRNSVNAYRKEQGLFARKCNSRRPSFARKPQRRKSVSHNIEVVGTKSMEHNDHTEILVPKNSNLKTCAYKLVDSWNRSYFNKSNEQRPKTRDFVLDWKIEPW